MTTDLTMLVLTALLALFVPLIYGAGRIQAPDGSAWAFGNRDTVLAVPPWVDRAVRAHANLTEGLAPFAILVLVAAVSGRADATTARGATLFFWARVAHVVIYVAGIQYLRTLAFFLGVVGEVMILSQLW